MPVLGGFRVGDQDARKLEDGFSFFEAQDIQSLGRGEAICRVERSDFDFNLSIPSPTERLPNEDIRQKVIESSRSKYSSSRNEVEAMLAKDREASEKENDSRPPLLSPSPEAENHAEVPTISKPEPKRKPAKELRSEPTLLGRGGPQHKYLQHLIKQLAIGLKFEVDVEKEVLNGEGSVDVALKKGDRLFAFEISMTTDSKDEISNIKNRLKAGFHEVIVVCMEEAKLRKLKEAVSSALPGENRVHYCVTENLSTLLLELAAKCNDKETVSYGKKTKVAYRPVSPEEAARRREALIKATTKSLKKLKD